MEEMNALHKIEAEKMLKTFFAVELVKGKKYKVSWCDHCSGGWFIDTFVDGKWFIGTNNSLILIGLVFENAYVDGINADIEEVAENHARESGETR